jgi:hypothetical protein
MGKNNLFDFHDPSRLDSANAGRGRNNQGCMIRKSDKIPGHLIPIRAAGHPSIMARYPPPTLLRIRCPCNLKHTQYPDQQDDASQISWRIVCWVVSILGIMVLIFSYRVLILLTFLYACTPYIGGERCLQLTFYNVTVEAGTRPLMAHSVGWY